MLKAIGSFLGFSADKAKPESDEFASVGSDWKRKFLPSGIIDPEDEILKDIAPKKLKGSLGETRDMYRLWEVIRKRVPQANSAMRTRKRALIGKPMQVLPNPDDPDQDRAVDVADFVQAMVGGIKEFKRDLREMMDAIPAGREIEEAIWEAKDKFTYKGGTRFAWAVTELKQRRYSRFGHTKDGELRYVPDPGVDVAVPPCKIMVCTHEPINEDPDGCAEVSEFFWCAFFWIETTRAEQIFQDKYGMPTATAQYPVGTSRDEQRKLLRLISRLQTQYAAVYPKNIEVKLLEAQRAGGVNTFAQAKDYWDRCMSQLITGQSLATNQSTTGTGALSMSQVHDEVRQEVVDADADELRAWVEGQLFRWIVDFNFGFDVPAPILGITTKAADLAKDAALDQQLVGMGMRLSRKDRHAHYNRVEAEDDDDALTGKPAPAAFDLDGVLGGGKSDEQEDGNNGKKGKDGNDAQDDKDLKEKKDKKNSATLEHGVPRRHLAIDEDALSEAKRRATELDTVFARIRELGVAAYKALTDDVAEEARLTANLPSLYEKLRLMQNARRFSAGIADAMAVGKITGYLMAAAQVRRHADEEGALPEEAHASAAGRVKLLAMEKPLADYEPVTPEAAILWFENLVALTKAQLEMLPHQVRATAFIIGEIEERSVLERIREEIAEYMREGKSLQEWQREFPSLLDQMGVTGLKPHRVEEIFRTNVQRAYGAGRTEALLDPEVKAAFPMWQRVAVGDDRTRKTHQSMNGFTRSPDDPIWYKWNAPNDYNCRCDVIPLTARQIELRGIEETETVLYEGVQVDPQTLPTNANFRGLGL